MMSIVPFVLFGLSVGTVVFIIARNYTKILLIDVQTLPEYRDRKKKEVYIRKKAVLKSQAVYSELAKKSKPLVAVLMRIQKSFRLFVGSVERKSVMHESNFRGEQHTPAAKTKVKKESAKQLVIEATHDVEQDDYPTAEKKFLAALKQDPKNIEAYKGLAHVYYAQNQLTEAKETYKFITQLNPQDEEPYLRLGAIAEEEGNSEESINNYQQAVLINPHNAQRFNKLFDLLFDAEQYETALEAIEQALELEPQNPKYLDNFIEVSILIGRKDLALEGYKQLRMINPENQKLEVFRQRIDEMR